MRLTKGTDIALRIAMRLAVIEGQNPTTREVAAAVDVPYTHAAKVVSLPSASVWWKPAGAVAAGSR